MHSKIGMIVSVLWCPSKYTNISGWLFGIQSRFFCSVISAFSAHNKAEIFTKEQPASKSNKSSRHFTAWRKSEKENTYNSIFTVHGSERQARVNCHGLCLHTNV